MRMDSPVKDPIDIIDNKFEENEEPGSPIIRDEEKRSNDGNKSKFTLFRGRNVY